MVEQTNMLTYIEAINAALKEEMRRDKRVVMWGEDLVSMDGIYGQTRGIFEEFGEDRIMDTPLVEQAIVGMAIGAALTGLRPVVDIMYSGFLTCCFDALFMKLSNLGPEFGYQGPVPVVVYSKIGAGLGFGADHSASLEALLIHSPRLKVVLPSTAYDAKGLLKAAIRDDYPAVYLPDRSLYFGGKEPVPSEDYIVPLGKADIKREGKDVTIVTYSAMVLKALTAAEALSKEGINAEVIDLRSLVPLDVDAIVLSVKKTSRLLIVHQSMKRGGVAGEIAFRVSEAAPDVVKAMKTPIKRLAAKNVSLPRGIELERALLPQVDDVIKAVKKMV